ncbi:MAG TPA: Calx-beta domain-containing protein [Tepidisphaeraceae bacterium]
MPRQGRSRRRNNQVVISESLESRRLLSLAVDLRIDVGNAANNDPSSIINQYTISNPKAGDTYAIEVWAVIHGTNTTGSDDFLDEMFGSLIASNLRTGGYFGAVEGNFSIPTLIPHFDSTTYQAGPGVTYTDANGNTDIGTTSTSTLDAGEFFHPSVTLGGDSSAAPPSNLLGEGSADAGQEQEIATTTFTVTSVVSGPPTQLEFLPRPQPSGGGTVTALWEEDGNIVDTLDDTSAVFETGQTITINEPDTIAPTASAAFNPILGSSTNYQFTVTYSDNQDLYLNDFNSTNILVTGPNGYSQLASYISKSDANVSSNPQYDPYAAVYQISSPDSSWTAADNGTYTFTLEPNQIADNSGNYAASTSLGTEIVEIQGAASITASSSSVPENSTTPAQFVVSRTDALNNGFALPMTVSYTVGGTAAAGTNYTALSGTVTIPAGQSSATIDVQPIDDQSVDPDTNLTVTLTQGASYTIGSPANAAMTIQNTDTTAASITDEEIARSSSDQTITFPVTLSVAPAEAVYVDYTTVDGTAIAGTDYTAASGVLIFDSGSTTPETPLTVTVLGSVANGDRTFGVNLTVDSQSTSEVTLADSSATGTIADVVGASLSPATLNVSPSINATSAAYTVTLANASTQTLTVDYATTDGTATAGTDYTATSGTLTFQPGQTTATISVPINATVRSNAGKTFTLSISSSDSLVSVDSAAASSTVTLLTPSFNEVSINPKKGATYIDAAGNKVTVKVSNVSASFIGNIIFPSGGAVTGVNAVGIVLDGTTAKTTLTITTKSTTLDFIDVNGSLKAISAKGVSLAQSSATTLAPYVTTTGTAGAITIGNLSSATITTSGEKTIKAGNLTNGTLNLSGAVAPKITLGNIQDSEITDSGSISSFNANQWLNTDSTADLLSVNGLSSMNIKGNFQAALSAGIVGTVAIKGAWSNSLFELTSVKKMSVGTATASTLAASVSVADAFPPTSAELGSGGQITAFSVTSKAANAFSSSIIEGQYIGTVVLGNVNATNAGNVFGVAAENIKSITGSDSKGKFSQKNLSNTQTSTPVSDQDFNVEIVS